MMTAHCRRPLFRRLPGPSISTCLYERLSVLRMISRQTSAPCSRRTTESTSRIASRFSNPSMAASIAFSQLLFLGCKKALHRRAFLFLTKRDCYWIAHQNALVEVFHFLFVLNGR